MNVWKEIGHVYRIEGKTVWTSRYARHFSLKSVDLHLRMSAFSILIGFEGSGGRYSRDKRQTRRGVAEREYRSSYTIQKIDFRFPTYGGIADLTQFLPFFSFSLSFSKSVRTRGGERNWSLVCPKPRSYTDIVDIPMFVDKYVFWTWLQLLLLQSVIICYL